MNPTKHFASLLYFAVLLCFIVAAAFFIVNISAKFFGTDGQYNFYGENGSSFTIGSKNSEGSLVPVDLHLTIPDSIPLNKKHFGVLAMDTYPSVSNMYLEENKKIKALNVYDIHSMKTSSYSVAADEKGNYINKKPSKFKFIKYENQGNSQYLRIKTNDSFTNAVLIAREHLSFLFYILEMYFLALILKEIAKEIYFSQTLASYISKLGYILLFSQLIPIIYCFIDLRLFGGVEVTPQVLASLKNTYFENIQVYFNPTMDIKIYMVLVGSILVLITKLVKRGRSLEEENELTI
jgi:hypothetical protein